MFARTEAEFEDSLIKGLEGSLNAFMSLPYASSMMGDIAVVGPQMAFVPEPYVPQPEAAGKVKTGNYDDLPSNAQNAYKGYEKNGWKGNYSGQASGTRAGKVYDNYDFKLPTMDSRGNSITYKEFDVNPPTSGIGRDASRFVTGSDGSIYYTDSHYGQSVSPTGLPPFIKIK